MVSELERRVVSSVDALHKAIMQLTGYGANNTSYLLEVRELIKDQQVRIEELEEKNKFFQITDSLKIYKKALMQIATGEILGEVTNYKDTLNICRNIAKEALSAAEDRKVK